MSTPQLAMQSFRTHLAGYRVTRDVEGWPVTPGRLGQIEYHDGRDLAAFTDRPRTAHRLLALPGVRRHQTGDQEVRVLFPPSALSAVVRVVGARRKRSLSPEQARRISGLPTLRGPSRPQEPPLAHGVTGGPSRPSTAPEDAPVKP